jgi:hypothetical protein
MSGIRFFTVFFLRVFDYRRPKQKMYRHGIREKIAGALTQRSPPQRMKAVCPRRIRYPTVFAVFQCNTGRQEQNDGVRGIRQCPSIDK